MQLSFTINNILELDAPFVYGRYLNADLLNHDVNGRTFRLMFTYFINRSGLLPFQQKLGHFFWTWPVHSQYSSGSV